MKSGAVSAGIVAQPLMRAAAAAAIGAVASALCLVGVYSTRADLTLEMDRELPRRIAAGLYPPERAGDLTFAWTSARAELRLRGLTRTAPVTCAVDFRGGRPPDLGQPTVEVAVDGVTLARKPASNDYQRVEVTAPAQPGRTGLSLAIAASDTVIPGASDPRELGVQIDRVVCTRDRAFTSPPNDALQSVTLSGLVMGAALGLSLSMTPALFGAILLAAAQALPLASGVAPYTAFPETALRIAIWTGLGMFLTVALLELKKREPLHDTARFVVVFSAWVLYLKLLGLLHPAKLLIDALFHAHRFQAVLGGEYYFTQIMPSGVTFPYAVGLYVVAAPWAAFTRDHVLLLRVVVLVAEAIAGALLYVLVAKAWKDRTVGALTVVLFHTVPLPYGLIGNANLTNAFGQSAALLTVATAATWSLLAGNVVALLALLVMASLAFLSHISTAALLGATLLMLCILYRWLGDSATRQSAVPILIVTVVAGLLSWGIYYGHFTDVYATALDRVAPTSRAETASNQSIGATASSTAERRQANAPTLLSRTAGALSLTARAIGWPIVLLGVVGMWQVWKRSARDGLTLLLAAWGAAYLIFVGVGVLPRVEAPFQRYAAEFVGRVVFATYAAAVVFAARGGAWALRGSLALRLSAVACLVWSVVNGMQSWLGWFR